MAAQDYRDPALYCGDSSAWDRLAAGQNAPAALTGWPLATPAGAETQDSAPPSLWPLLCSAVLIGIMLGSEMGRAYRIGVRGDATHRPATAAFGAAPSGAEPRACLAFQALIGGAGVLDCG